MAKTAGNKGKSGKGKPSAKGGSGAKAPAKRVASKPARNGKGSQRPQQKARGAKPGEKRGIRKFLHDVRIELGKVTWPSRKDLAQSTLVVLVAVAIAAAYTFALDEVFSQAVDHLISLITS